MMERSTRCPRQVLQRDVADDDSLVVQRRATKPVIGASLEDARPGDVVLFGRRGLAISGRRVHALSALAAAGFAVATGGVLWLLGQAVWLGLSTGPIVYRGIRRDFKAFARGHSELSLGNLDKAEGEFKRLHRRLARRFKWKIEIPLAKVAWCRGDFEGARQLLENVCTRGKGIGKAQGLLLLSCVASVQGDISAAVRALERASDVPDVGPLALQRALAHLLIAFHSGHLDRLPNENELHALGTAALATNIAGDVLVLLAWVSHKREDHELSDHWLSESQSRLTPCLRAKMPKVDAWMLAQLSERGLGDSHDA